MPKSLPAVIFLLFCPFLPAQTADSAFFALNAAYVTAAAVDGHSTVRFLETGCCHETNPLLGKYPSPARVWGQGAAMAGGIVLADYYIKKRFAGTRWKWLWVVPPVAGAVAHGFLAHHNYRLAAQYR